MGVFLYFSQVKMSREKVFENSLKFKLNLGFVLREFIVSRLHHYI